MNILETLSGPGYGPIATPNNEQSGKESPKDGVDAWFVDLFVRCNNGRATEMYEKMGYSVFRRVVE